MRNGVFAAVLLPSALCQAVEPPSASVKIVSEVETARMQMGRIDDDTPHWQVIAYPELAFAHVVDVGMMLYTDTRLTDRRDATLRRAFYETDYFPFVRWNWVLSEGWTLSTQPQMGFSYIHHSKSFNNGETAFYGDFRWTETLTTPYGTAFVYFRRIYDPGYRMNGHIGLSRTFTSPLLDLQVKPFVLFFFGNAEENALRFGLDPKWNGENRHKSNFSSIMPGMVVSKKINDRMSCFVSFKELVVVNSACRNTLSQRSRPVNHRDYAIFSVGVTMIF